MQVLRASDRGITDLGWLDSKHSFAFGRAWPEGPHARGYRSLRVINDDIVAPGAGFPEHGHDNMEIITVVLTGGLAHKDSTGSSSTITPGMVQRMTAGSGIRHSEFNASGTEPVHLLQIWIHPDRRNLEPSYEEATFDFEPGVFTLVASRQPAEGEITIHQDARLYVGVFEQGQAASLDIDTGRGVWVHIAEGAAEVNAHPLNAGDGAAIDDPGRIDITHTGTSPARVLIFDLA